MTAVSFIGLGRMGQPMARNIARAGFELSVYNRSAHKAEQLAAEVQASVARTPRECAESSTIVITMLADEFALRQALQGPDGVLAGLQPGALVVDMGTTGPTAVRDLSPVVAAAGGILLDAPVSGSTASAAAATLTIMVGGPEHAVAAALPVLACMAARVVHLGPVGAGAAMKLAVNLVVFGITQAVSEALVLAERAGIDREAAYGVFEESAVSAPVVKYRHDAYLFPDSTPTAFSLDLAAKDLRLILDFATQVGARVPQSVTNLEVVDSAIDQGYGDLDLAGIATLLRSMRP